MEKIIDILEINNTAIHFECKILLKDNKIQ